MTPPVERGRGVRKRWSGSYGSGLCQHEAASLLQCSPERVSTGQLCNKIRCLAFIFNPTTIIFLEVIKISPAMPNVFISTVFRQTPLLHNNQCLYSLRKGQHPAGVDNPLHHRSYPKVGPEPDAFFMVHHFMFKF